MKRFSTILLVCLFSTIAVCEDYKAIFWNLESGESDADTIAAQMAAKGAIDFWGLSEVPDQSFLATLEAKISAETGVNYEMKISEDPSSLDKLAIIFNADRLSSVPYSGTHPVDDIGDNFFEVQTVQISAGLRPSLGVQLKDRDGQSVVVLVNHFKAFGGHNNEAKRKQQAEATDVFVAMTPGVPIIIGGDHNMPLQAEGTGLDEPAFEVLDQQCDYLEPTNVEVSGTFKNGSVLDSIWLANDLDTYLSEVQILNRNGNALASTFEFSDSNDDTDHRPLLMTVQFADADERIEALKEDITILEATLARMRSTLGDLESARSENN